MIKVLDVERRLPDGSIRVHLIADSTLDTLPTNCEQVTGLDGDYPIGIGSSCITASLDIALLSALIQMASIRTEFKAVNTLSVDTWLHLIQ